MKKSLLALLAALLLLGAVLLLRDRREKALRAEGFAFDTAQKAGVAGLRIAVGKDTLTMLKIADGRWITAGDSFPVDDVRLQKRLGILLGLRTRETVSESRDPVRLAEYGLDSAQARRVEWTTGAGRKTRVLIGKISNVDFTSTYWKREGDAVVYRTPGSFSWEISARPEDWKDRALFPKFAAKDVRFVAADWRDAAGRTWRYKVERMNDTTARLVEPDTVPAPWSTAIVLFMQAPLFGADEFVARGDTNLARAGLEDPLETVTITLRNGTTHSVRAGKAFGGFNYALHSGGKNPVRIFDWRLKYFLRTPGELAAGVVNSAGLKPPRP